MKYKIYYTGKTMADADRKSIIVEGKTIKEIQDKVAEKAKYILGIFIKSEKIEG